MPKIKKVRVIVDPRDATRDKWIASALADALYRAGRLQFDVTNMCYCV